MAEGADGSRNIALTKEDRLRFAKFCLVGGSGVLVNKAVLWLSMEHLLLGLAPGPRLSWSGLVAIAVAILTNFLMNDAWTWRDRTRSDARDPFPVRLGKYYLVASAAGLVQWSLLKLLTESFGWHYLLSNLVGIGAGLVINFFVNHLWTFRKKEE